MLVRFFRLEKITGALEREAIETEKKAFLSGLRKQKQVKAGLLKRVEAVLNFPTDKAKHNQWYNETVKTFTELFSVLPENFSTRYRLALSSSSCV